MTESVDGQTFGALVAGTLGAHLPEDMSAAIPLAGMPPEALAFIRRMLDLMRRAAYPVTEFNAILFQVLSTMIPNMLPCAWGGRVPPITHPDRHRQLDTYVAKTHGGGAPQRLFVDLGCGFPPVTTAETARRFPDWRVLGVDRTFARDVVIDPDGHYACFDAEGAFLYFQAMMTPSGRAMYKDSAATRKTFQDLFEDLRRRLPNNTGEASETATLGGSRLVRNHLKDFETGNLSFLESDIEDLDLPPADVIRCMNVLVYADADARRRLVRRIGAGLRSGGLFIAGTNGAGFYRRYTVYENGPGGLAPREFSFSLENLRPFGLVPWFTIHDGDPEAMLLADLSGTLRTDAGFWHGFDHRVDTLLAQTGVCHRGEHGYLVFPEEMPPTRDLMEKMTDMWRRLAGEGFTAGAVEALRRAGWEAWENAAGDIAVKPGHSNSKDSRDPGTGGTLL